MTAQSPRPPRLPKILGWIASSLVILLLGLVGYSVVTLDSRPGGTGADPEAKLFVALLVAAAAVLTGLLVRAVAALLLHRTS